MESIPRHQCLIYQGAPSRLLPQMAAAARDKLAQNFRCVYLNSPPMVAGMRSYLASAGVDVEKMQTEGRLVLSSKLDHLLDGRFDGDRMIRTLEQAIQQAVQDGYAGLWATGDMTWEMGPERDFGGLLTYERQLEELFGKYPQLSGICQYHAETLPHMVLRQALISHPAIYVNATLARLNPSYMRPEEYGRSFLESVDVDSALVLAALSFRPNSIV